MPDPVIVPKYVPKAWGGELWLANNEKHNYCAKILDIVAGQHLSLHYHLIKHETFSLLEGDATIILIDPATSQANYIDLIIGNCIEIQIGQAHSVMTKNGCKLFESSTFHRDEDSYRVPWPFVNKANDVEDKRVKTVISDTISDLARNGLETDGAHNKQWFLSKILGEVDPAFYRDLKKSRIDIGVAP